MKSSRHELGSIVIYPEWSDRPYMCTLRRQRIDDEYLELIEYRIGVTPLIALPYLNSQWFPLRSNTDIQELTLDVSLLTFGDRTEHHSMVLDMHWDEFMLGSRYPVGDTYQEATPILEDRDLAIWWTDQTSAEYLKSYWEGSRAYLGIPSYIRTELSSRYGRAGNGRLWVNTDRPVISEVSGVTRYNLDAFNGMGYSPMDACGGIVIYRRHLPHLMKHFPGAFTTLAMEPIGKGPDVPTKPPLHINF